MALMKRRLALEASRHSILTGLVLRAIKPKEIERLNGIYGKLY